MNKEGKWHLDEDVDWMWNEMAVLKDWLKTCLENLRDAGGQLRGTWWNKVSSSSNYIKERAIEAKLDVEITLHVKIIK